MRATLLEGLAGDLRHAWRVCARQPLLTGLVIVTLSLAIGANAAVFSVLQAVLLRPLPYQNADRLALVVEGRRGDRSLSSPTVPEMLELRAASRSLDRLTFFDSRDFQIIGGDEPERVAGARVEPSFLSTLGVRPEAGRIFGEGDAGREIVVLSSGLWRRNFGGDRSVIGRTLSLNGTPHEIVGVLPDTFSFGYLSPASIDLFIPYPMSAEYTSRTGEFAGVRRVQAVARLANGVSLEAASAELATIATAMAAQYPQAYKGSGANNAAFFMTVQPLEEWRANQSRPVLVMLVGAIALVLLIACANTAQFLLAQAIEREPEVAVRSALGANRARLLRQFVSEGVLITGVAGAFGVLQAVWLTNVLRSLIPRGTPLVGDIAVDAGMVLFLLTVTLASGVACSLAPALRFARTDVVQGFNTRGASAHRSRLRQAFITAEVAMSLVLLVGAGLLLSSLLALQREQGGFSTDRVTSMRIRGMDSGGTTGEVYGRYLQEIARVPGVDAVGMASSVMPGRPGTAFTIEGASGTAADLARQRASYQIVSSGYFATLGIPLETGRVFNEDDAAGRPPVAVVNREMARRFWPDGNPVGRRIRAGDGPRNATMTVIGIAGNVRPPLQTGDVPQIYVSYRQQSEANMAIVVRTVTPDLPLAGIKTAIWGIEPRQAVFGVTTLDDQLMQATSNQRGLAVLIGGFAILALAMSISGIYTVITYLVSRRVREIAVRRAIGASSRDVLWALAAPTVRWTILGLVAGAAGAFAGVDLLRSAATGILPLDGVLVAALAVTYLCVVLIVIGTAARSALRIDPAAALRAD